MEAPREMRLANQASDAAARLSRTTGLKARARQCCARGAAKNALLNILAAAPASPLTQAPAKKAMDVTEAAMVAALEVFREGETITPDHQEAIALGLLRAAARWWVMTTPDIADEGARNGFALCLKQERVNQSEPKETVQ